MQPTSPGRPFPMPGTILPGKGGETLPQELPALRHVGLYAYRASFLHAYAGLAPAPTERFESLEQLRALWHGYRISVLIVDVVSAPVDTPEDADRMSKVFAQRV